MDEKGKEPIDWKTILLSVVCSMVANLLSAFLLRNTALF